MILADVNVLLSAFRPDAEHYKPSRKWLDACTAGQSAFGVSAQVLSSVIRVATHRKIFKTPSILTEVIDYCNKLLSHPNARIVAPGDRHWEIFTGLCIAANAKENLVPDAWFAALAIEHDCEWITFDRDYARFPGLKWRVPE